MITLHKRKILLVSSFCTLSAFVGTGCTQYLSQLIFPPKPEGVLSYMRITKIIVPATASLGSHFLFRIDYLGKEAGPRIGYYPYGFVEAMKYPFTDTPTGRVVAIMVATDSSVNPLSFSTPGTINGDYVATATGTLTFEDSGTQTGNPASASITITDK